MSSLKAFKNQFLLDRDFSPAVDEGVMRMEVFLVPAGSDETAFEHEMIAALGALDISTGWGLEESECDGRGWRALLMLTKWESLAQSESVLGASSQSLRAITMDRAGAKSLVVRKLEKSTRRNTLYRANCLQHHIKWKNPLAQAGLAVSGGTNQRG
ncbi:hypothetical protein CTA1_4113 [Colletotrichum tanaceti]|uniref:Uncharacterized protein n=1 Tax=Colletotrichum tanaceti TaxID=1306861 RepID=A0A4U6XHT1_9PEZI|nr:hypothetical protein CTA1_4113 [Colletotrichum tanaceti]